MEIKKVQKRKDGTKLVIVPRNSEIDAGDYVRLEKIKSEVSA